jgi:hypothetical protein
MKPKLFISFDYENDKRYKFLLTALSNNRQFEIEFNDRSSGEINSENIPTVKAGLTRRINSATHTLVIVGEYANSFHKDWNKIGYKNWINFEIAKSKEARNKLIAVKIDRQYDSPEELLGLNASWAYAFDVDAITRAINNA